jgi:hypothetical protein
MVQRLENKIHSVKTKQDPIIDFEKNDNLRGLEHIETLYQAILNKRAVEFTYRSFKARQANDFTFHPYYLKEYRNRWFVLGVKKKDTPIMTLALDRIIEIRESTARYVAQKEFNPSQYFQDVIGVSVNPDSPPDKVVLFADNETAPYIITKPLHHSQHIEQTLPGGVVFSIWVQLNFELEREILGFGDRIRVIGPHRLKRRIKEQFENALDYYHHELSDVALQGVEKKLAHKGYAILNHVFGKKEVNIMKAALHNYLKEHSQEEPHAIRNLLEKIPLLSKMIFNANLKSILSRLDKSLFLSKAIYFDKSPEANWYVTWHQDMTINVKTKTETEDFSGWTKKERGYSVVPPEEILKNTVTIRIHLDITDEQNGALKIVPGSHNKKLTTDEIQLITQNSVPVVCDIDLGGIHLMKPLLLHASSKATNQKHRRVLHLEFNTMELPNGLEWAERLAINQ